MIAPWRFAAGFSVRFFYGMLLLAGSVCLQPATAQQNAPISPSLVLVLKLVSNTLVKPTTGIVVSNDGMVLVPASFVADEGEMIVLDGGADIASNGRPAKLMAGTGSGDLALLTVKGLKRPGISFSGNFTETAGALRLEAFPPAGEIAKGASPLSMAAKFLPDGQSGQFVISADTPLPYVTGAILDDCGYLAGVSLASGPQSLDSGKATEVIFGDGLSGLLAAMQVALPTASCKIPENQPVAPAATPVKSAATAGTEKIAGPEIPAQDETIVVDEAPAPAGDATEPAGGMTAETPARETVVAAPEQTDVATVAERRSIWQHVPAWLWVLVIVVFGVIVLKSFHFFRLLNHSPATSGQPGATAAIQPASDEPDTAPLEDAADGSALKPRSAPVADLELPELAAKPDGCNGLVLVTGYLDADTPFKRFCFVDSGQIDIVIGRGDADIAIEHATVSRRHARIRSDGEQLTFSDLGSRNGSFIGEAPCLAGEIMYFAADDEIFLGDVRVTISVVVQEAEWA